MTARPTGNEPALRVHDAPPLDVTAIDNLPSLLPVESSEDYAGQLLPSLLTLASIDAGVWGGPRPSSTAIPPASEERNDMTIHWCGTGLSSVPGLRRLIEGAATRCGVNRTVEKAREAVGDLTDDIRPYTLEALTEALQPGDVAISMLPADQHVSIAKACLARGRTSSRRAISRPR